MLKKFSTFSVVGGLATALHYLILVSLVEFASFPVIIAATTGATFGALTSFVLNGYFTFSMPTKKMLALRKYMMVAASGIFLNAILMWIFVNKVAIYYMAAQILSTVILLFYNFALSNCWVYKEKA